MWLLKHGANINSGLDENAPIPLCFALLFGHNHTVDILLNQGAKINYKYTDSSPLDSAISSGNIEIVENLLNHGADIDDNGRYPTPLCLACETGSLAIVKCLVAHNARINLNKNYISPLFISSKNGYTKIVSFLVSKGANINCNDNFGDSPLYWAIRHKDFEMTKLLIENGADMYTINKPVTPLEESERFENGVVSSYILSIITSRANNHDKKAEIVLRREHERW